MQKQIINKEESNVLKSLQELEQSFEQMVKTEETQNLTEQLNQLTQIMIMCREQRSQKKPIKKYFNNILNYFGTLLLKFSLSNEQQRGLNISLDDLCCNKFANCSNVNKLKKQLGMKIERTKTEKQEKYQQYSELANNEEQINEDGKEDIEGTNQLLQFLKLCQKRNKQEIAIAICDENGKFVMYDKKLIEPFLDQRKENLLKKSLFDFMIPLSKIYLWTKFNGLKEEKGESLIQKLQFPLDKQQFVITFTNYSTLARKKVTLQNKQIKQKLMKYLRNSQAKKQKYTKLKSIDKDEKTLIENESFELYFKYCKTLTARTTLIKLQLSKEVFININNDKSSFLEFNSKYPQIQEFMDSSDKNNLILNNLFLLEIRKAQHIQQFDYEQIRADKKILKWEGKIYILQFFKEKVEKAIKKNLSILSVDA